MHTESYIALTVKRIIFITKQDNVPGIIPCVFPHAWFVMSCFDKPPELQRIFLCGVCGGVGVWVCMKNLI